MEHGYPVRLVTARTDIGHEFRKIGDAANYDAGANGCIRGVPAQIIDEENAPLGGHENVSVFQGNASQIADVVTICDQKCRYIRRLQYLSRGWALHGVKSKRKARIVQIVLL